VHGFLPGATLARRLAAGAVILIAACVFATGLLGTVQPAAAQQGFGNYFGYQTQKRPRRRAVRRRQHRSSHHKTAEKKKDEVKEKAPSGPVYIVISIGDQHISVYDANGRIARSIISTGVRGLDTPQGVFSVIGKERYHYSNLYGGAPMPWMQRITWSGVAMHAGHVTGYPASHGCIRLLYSFAPRLWKMTKMGARVVVSPRDTTPFEIAHEFLPLPKMQPAPVSAGSQQASRRARAPVELASLNPPSSAISAEAEMEATPSAKALNPMAYATALKERAKTDKVSADKAAKELLAAAQAAGAEARKAVDDVHQGEADLEAAKARIAELDAQASTTASGDAPDAKSAEEAATARTAAQSEFIRARAALEEARRRESIETPAAFTAVQEWKVAVATSKAAAKTLKEAKRRTEPVSVFISKKEGRVFIRQDWKEVYEAPVTIRDPDRPLGTHVYIAVAAEPDGSAMRWSAIDVPESGKSRSRRPSRKKSEDPPEEKPLPAETAAGALDRIKLPPGVRERISELLWTGASLIISDHARSDEMDNDSDFIILTR